LKPSIWAVLVGILTAITLQAFPFLWELFHRAGGDVGAWAIIVLLAMIPAMMVNYHLAESLEQAARRTAPPARLEVLRLQPWNKRLWPPHTPAQEQARAELMAALAAKRPVADFTASSRVHSGGSHSKAM
jgi:hypothetical protein